MLRSLPWLSLAAALATASAAEPTFQICIGNNCPNQQPIFGKDDPWSRPPSAKNRWSAAPSTPPPIQAVGNQGFATTAEVDAAVGGRRYEFECPATRDISNTDTSVAFERGARVFLGKLDANYAAPRIESTILKDAIQAVWDHCPMSSTPPFGGPSRGRYEVGFLDVFIAGSPPKLVLHSDQFYVLGGRGHWSHFNDVGAQEARELAARAAEEQRRQEIAARAAAAQQQLAAEQAAQQAASQERQRVETERTQRAQLLLAERQEAGRTWWGWFWLFALIAGVLWALIRFHEPIFHWYFMLTPMPATFNYDEVLAQNAQLSGSAIFVKFRMRALKIKLDAWKERNDAELAAVQAAAARDAAYDRAQEERHRAKVHRSEANRAKMSAAEQNVFDDKVANIKHGSDLNKQARSKEAAEAKADAIRAQHKAKEAKEGKASSAARAKRTFSEEARKIDERHAERKKVILEGNYSPEERERLLKQLDIRRENEMQDLMSDPDVE
ncbi:MAG: hypothetical protein U1E87_01650 [Alphaproteobacteria bacterium]